MLETQVRSLGQKDPLEKEMATHSSTLAWKIPWTGAWWATVHRARESDTTEQLHFHFQRIAQRDKKAFLNEQCLIIEGSNKRGENWKHQRGILLKDGHNNR